jgi:hypothetical protein
MLGYSPALLVYNRSNLRFGFLFVGFMVISLDLLDLQIMTGHE